MSNRILELINRIFRQDKFTISISEALVKKFEDIEAKIEDIHNNNFLKTSTWGLDIFEKELNLSNTKGKTLDERRSIISAKWRGVGTLTLDLIKSTVSAYTNADVEVTFDGVINIKFISTYGIPPNMEDVYNTIEEIKPAHLEVKYSFRYRTHKELSMYTHKELGKYSHTDLREGVI